MGAEERGPETDAPASTRLMPSRGASRSRQSKKVERLDRFRRDDCRPGLGARTAECSFKWQIARVFNTIDSKAMRMRQALLPVRVSSPPVEDARPVRFFNVLRHGGLASDRTSDPFLSPAPRGCSCAPGPGGAVCSASPARGCIPRAMQRGRGHEAWRSCLPPAGGPRQAVHREPPVVLIGRAAPMMRLCRFSCKAWVVGISYAGIRHAVSIKGFGMPRIERHVPLQAVR